MKKASLNLLLYVIFINYVTFATETFISLCTQLMLHRVTNSISQFLKSTQIALF